MRVLFSIALVIGTLVGCLEAQTRANKPAPYIDPEAYAVYSEVIMKEWPVTVAKAKRLIIQAENAESIAIGSQKAMCLKPSPTASNR